MNPKIKAIVILSVTIGIIWFGVAVFCLFDETYRWMSIIWAAFGVLCLLPILPAKNRRIRFYEDDFTYRTWLGNEYRFRYRDVLWYKMADHDLYLHTAKKRLIIDRDVEDAAPMQKRLDAYGIPNRKPIDLSGISSDTGETPKEIYFRRQRVTVTILLICTALLWIGMSVVLALYAAKDGMRGSRTLLYFFYVFAACWVVYCIAAALFSWNGRVEIYRNHFIYRTWLGARRDYAFSDCVSRKEKEYVNMMNAKNRIYRAKIRMQDGSCIRIDNRMLEDGLAASLNYRKLPKE